MLIEDEDSKDSQEMIELEVKGENLENKNFELFVSNLHKDINEKQEDKDRINKIMIYFKIWEIMMNIISIWMLLFIPYFIAFRQKYSLGLRIANSIFDILYICEIGVQIYKNYLKDRRMEPKKVKESINTHVTEYFKKFFYLDILAAIPFNLIDLAFGGPMSLRWLRLMRIVRLMHWSKLMKWIEKKFLFENPFFGFAVLLFYYLYWIHMFTCILYYFSLYLGFDNTWSFNQLMEKKDNHVRYITSFYFATATVAMAGYGDIYPVRTGERIFISCVQFYAVLFVAYSTAQITNFISKFQDKRNKRKKYLEKVKNFAIFKKFEPKFSKYLFSISKHNFNVAYHKSFDERSIILSLPPNMRASVIRHIIDTTLYNWSVLKLLPTEIVQEILFMMERVFYERSEEIFTEGSSSDNMFFIEEGAVIALKEGDTNGLILRDG